MENVFKLEGMTCQGCADTIQGGLNEQSFIEKAKVSLEETTLYVTAKQSIDINSLNSIVSGLGNYKVRPYKSSIFSEILNYFISKKPIVIALAIVILSSFAMQIPNDTFEIKNLFMSYMGIFFILFSFLKLLNVSGFSMTFKKYDLISKVIPGFAISYPFIELALGIIYLAKIESVLIYINILTISFMTSQSIGIARALINSEQIQCACMGSAVDVPLSSLTLVENFIMIIMSGYMISILVWLMINYEPTMPLLLLPAITFLMISFGTRFTVISNLIRKIHDESTDKSDLKTKDYRIRINSEISALNKRLLLTQILQISAGLGFLFNLLAILMFLVENKDLSFILFMSGLVTLIISIVLFIIEISISSKSLRVHITDVEDENQ